MEKRLRVYATDYPMFYVDTYIFRFLDEELSEEDITHSTEYIKAREQLELEMWKNHVLSDRISFEFL